MRDYLAAVRDRVVVFDGGMGATLEQFDLDLERGAHTAVEDDDAASYGVDVVALGQGRKAYQP